MTDPPTSAAVDLEEIKGKRSRRLYAFPGVAKDIDWLIAEVERQKANVKSHWEQILFLIGCNEEEGQEIERLQARLAAAEKNAEMWHTQHATACSTLDRALLGLDRVKARVAAVEQVIDTARLAQQALWMHRDPCEGCRVASNHLDTALAALDAQAQPSE